MKSDINGISTCKAGKENYETFTVNVGRKSIERVQYDYRTPAGALFSCVGKNLADCRIKRDKWLTN